MSDRTESMCLMMGLNEAGEEPDYYCDKCEEPMYPNDESYEVRYGFICAGCAEV